MQMYEAVSTYRFNVHALFIFQGNTTVATLVLMQDQGWNPAGAVLSTLIHRPHDCSVSRGGCVSGSYHTHGKDWCASWRSGWNCWRGCGCGKRPWPRSARSARLPSASQSHSNPRSARTKAEGGPGNWGTSPLSSPSRQTPSRNRKKPEIWLSLRQDGRFKVSWPELWTERGDLTAGRLK